MTYGQGFEDLKIDTMRRNTARTLRGFSLVEESLARSLPSSMRPLLGRVTQAVFADMAKHGYQFLKSMEPKASWSEPRHR